MLIALELARVTGETNVGNLQTAFNKYSEELKSTFRIRIHSEIVDAA